MSIKLTSKAFLVCFSRKNNVIKLEINFIIKSPDKIKIILRKLFIKYEGESRDPKVTKNITENKSLIGLTSEIISRFTKLSEIITPAKKAPRV